MIIYLVKCKKTVFTFFLKVFNRRVIESPHAFKSILSSWCTPSKTTASYISHIVIASYNKRSYEEVVIVATQPLGQREEGEPTFEPKI